MRFRLLVAGSLALNLFLLVVLLAGRQREEREAGAGAGAGSGAERNLMVSDVAEAIAEGAAKEGAPAEAKERDWGGLESLGFPELVAHLRKDGCPEESIRDIVAGRLDRYLAEERGDSSAGPDLEWWRADADERLRAFMDREADALRRERAKRLAELLGAEAQAEGALESEPFYGKTLVSMPAAKKRIIRGIERRYAEKIAAALAETAGAGEAAGRLAVARLREEERAALEAAFNAREFEAYQLRYSELAKAMRRELAMFNASSNEFVAIFKLREPIEREIALKFPGVDAGSASARKDLERKAADEIRRTLGDERFREYEFNLDPVYRSARDFAAKVGAEAEKAMSLYEIGGWARLERQRIEQDASLDELSRRAALAETRRRLDQFLQQILSPEARRRGRELEIDFLDSLPR